MSQNKSKSERKHIRWDFDRYNIIFMVCLVFAVTLSFSLQMREAYFNSLIASKIFFYTTILLLISSPKFYIRHLSVIYSFLVILAPVEIYLAPDFPLALVGQQKGFYTAIVSIKHFLFTGIAFSSLGIHNQKCETKSGLGYKTFSILPLLLLLVLFLFLNQWNSKDVHFQFSGVFCMAFLVHLVYIVFSDAIDHGSLIAYATLSIALPFLHSRPESIYILPFVVSLIVTLVPFLAQISSRIVGRPASITLFGTYASIIVLSMGQYFYGECYGLLLGLAFFVIVYSLWLLRKDWRKSTGLLIVNCMFVYCVVAVQDKSQVKISASPFSLKPFSTVLDVKQNRVYTISSSKNKILALHLKSGGKDWEFVSREKIYSVLPLKKNLLLVQSMKTLHMLDSKTGMEIWSYSTPKEKNKIQKTKMCSNKLFYQKPNLFLSLLSGKRKKDSRKKPLRVLEYKHAHQISCVGDTILYVNESNEIIARGPNVKMMRWKRSYKHRPFLVELKGQNRFILVRIKQKGQLQLVESQRGKMRWKVASSFSLHSNTNWCIASKAIMVEHSPIQTRAINMETGKTEWRFSLKAGELRNNKILRYKESCSVLGVHLLLTHQRLVALSVDSGKALWSKALKDSPSINVIKVLRGWIFINDSNGLLQAINPLTGKIEWKIQTGELSEDRIIENKNSIYILSQHFLYHLSSKAQSLKTSTNLSH